MSIIRKSDCKLWILGVGNISSLVWNSWAGFGLFDCPLRWFCLKILATLELTHSGGLSITKMLFGAGVAQTLQWMKVV